MSNTKEIEEMAKDICHLRTCESKKNGGSCYKYCKAYIYAFRAINAGYRKQSVGEWVWADDGYCRCSVCTQKAPVTTQYQDEPMTTATKYCPWCGAKMKGKNDERVH